MDFPTDKNYMYFEDNGDGTITATMKLDEMQGTAVLPGCLLDMIDASMGPDFDYHTYMSDLVPKIVPIPDSLED